MLGSKLMMTNSEVSDACISINVHISQGDGDVQSVFIGLNGCSTQRETQGILSTHLCLGQRITTLLMMLSFNASRLCPSQPWSTHSSFIVNEV